MRRIGEISAVILLLSVSRLAITIPNLEPIGAAALFGGALLSSKYLRFIIPFVALFIGDLIISAALPSYSAHVFSPTFFAIYLSFGLTVLIGKRVIGKEARMLNVVKAGIASSAVFFLITNFVAWIDPVHSIYTKDLVGLLQSYAAGLAFYKNDVFGSFFFNTLMSNVGFSVLVFSVYNAYQKSFSIDVA